MKTILRTVGQKLLVLPIIKEETTLESGVMISNINNAQLGEAEVINVAKDLQHIYKVGEKVLYYEKRGVGVIHNNKPHQLIDGGDGLLQGDVLAIIE
jgi:co-chaperonin GroES (HSP10)